ncbi:hypothetical protein [Micromonospora sp. NPDC005707]|uniref:hypothetical protein n=1 Tax=Micromonospora sp. NPDC005707 TaxID=3157050 RepID=UPI0033D89CED
MNRRLSVVRYGKLHAAGLRLGDVIVYDWGFHLDNRPYERRSFVLLDDGFQIHEVISTRSA